MYREAVSAIAIVLTFVLFGCLLVAAVIRVRKRTLGAVGIVE
jgi:hypothetical protein